VQKSITLTVAALLIFAVYSTLRISYADFLFHKNTIDSVQRAVQLDPANAHYQAWLAELLENNGQDPTPALDAAARLNPLDSRVWIRRGLNAESAGNAKQAEQLLLHAAAIDRLMEPRWSLMNFYFRNGDTGNFWRWTKATFEISYGDRTPLFELCWRARPDPAFIAQILPSDYAVQFQFLKFLINKDRLPSAAALAERILPQATPPDTAAYTICADRLLQSGDSAGALQLWKALCRRGLLPYSASESLTNPAFEHEPLNLAFDWRLPATPGVSTLRIPPALRFTFTGQQPDTCLLLTQILPLEPSRTYRLSFQYRTSLDGERRGKEGVAPGSGLRIHVLDQITSDLSAESWTPQTLTFTAIAATAEIALEYRRPPGFVRIEGTLEIRNSALVLAQ
jgi:tetratricopeptide (TPR) repeat protein